jgi:hypothetical protein
MQANDKEVVPWLAGLSPRKPSFDPRPDRAGFVDKLHWGRFFSRVLQFHHVDPGSVHVGFVVDKVALGQVFPCQFHSTGAPLLGKVKKKNHHHKIAQ